MTKKIRKTEPAKREDSFEVTYTNFAANQEKTQMKTGTGERFDNDVLLQMLGFKNVNGELTLPATSNEVERDNKGKVTKRTSRGRTLTQDRQEAGQDR